MANKSTRLSKAVEKLTEFCFGNPINQRGIATYAQYGKAVLQTNRLVSVRGSQWYLSEIEFDDEEKQLRIYFEDDENLKSLCFSIQQNGEIRLCI